MPGTTTPDKLPFPEEGDGFDVFADIEDLASATQSVVSGINTRAAASRAVADGAAGRAQQYDTAPFGRLVALGGQTAAGAWTLRWDAVNAAGAYGTSGIVVSGQSTRIYATRDGWYFAGAMAGWNGADAAAGGNRGARTMEIRKNSAGGTAGERVSRFRRVDPPSGTSVGAELETWCHVQMRAGDYLEVLTNHGQGSGLGLSVESFIALQWVRPL